MTDIIALVVIAAIVCAAALYVYRAKKRGAKCIGCPAGENCAKGRGSCSCDQT